MVLRGLLSMKYPSRWSENGLGWLGTLLSLQSTLKSKGRRKVGAYPIPRRPLSVGKGPSRSTIGTEQTTDVARIECIDANRVVSYVLRCCHQSR